MYYHPTLKLLLMVYVDDFKMSGPAKNMPEGWRLIRQGIKTDEPQAAGKCLGCDHKVKSVKLNGRMVNQIEYDMQGFMEQCVSVYLELTKRDKSCLKNANTPFLDDNVLEKEAADLPPDQRGGTLQPIACKVLMRFCTLPGWLDSTC